MTLFAKSVVVVSFLFSPALRSTTMATAPAYPPIEYHETATGVRFGIWKLETAEAAPSPVLFILASTIEETLGTPYYRQAGNALAERGFLCVSVDLPGHGDQQDPGERAGLDGWRDRADRQENFVATSNQRLRDVLDHLISEGTADPRRIAAAGTSRGAFLALHFAAADPRVSCVAAFAPVTDLAALREFNGAENNPLVPSLSVINQSNALAARPVWVVIGDRDERVGTDDAIAFVRSLTTAALTRGLDAKAELHVLPEPKGHTTPAPAPAQAAAWILTQLHP